MQCFIKEDIRFKAPLEVSEWLILRKESWNDWFTYETLFSVYFNSREPETFEYLGAIKIGYFNESFTSRIVGKNEYHSPALESSFSYIGDDFFSVAQDSIYYRNIHSVLTDDQRIDVLETLNDISYSNQIFEKAINEGVTTNSLLRSVSINSVRGTYRRLALGDSRLTSFKFNYSLPDNEQSPLEVSVIPKTLPPTNIHVIIGRNGVGKTHLLNNLINLLITSDSKYGSLNYFVDESKTTSNEFANLLSISFSAFDVSLKETESSKINFSSITWKLEKSNRTKELSLLDITSEMFIESISAIKVNGKTRKWVNTIRKLYSDPIFKNNDLIRLIYSDSQKINMTFERLSSGHKIVLLTLTLLIEKLEEQSLVLLDEPELHLHPPLLAAFIRVLSELLISKNAVSIITTHSPVVLQEVPRKCVSVLNRASKTDLISLTRPNIETFGNNVGVLTSSIFNLEVTESGFHTILKELVAEHETIEDVLEVLDHQLGPEGLSILLSMFYAKNEGDHQ